MKRSEFLKICSRAAQADSKMRVKYDGEEYIPAGYEMRFDGQGNAIHKAILRYSGVAFIRVPLERVSA